MKFYKQTSFVTSVILFAALKGSIQATRIYKIKACDFFSYTKGIHTPIHLHRSENFNSVITCNMSFALFKCYNL
jgi:hypothetical protein